MKKHRQNIRTEIKRIHKNGENVQIRKYFLLIEL